MQDLAGKLSELALPELPSGFTESEAEQLLRILGNAHTRLRPYAGTFRAPWLLSQFESPRWHTTNRNREEQINGQWHNTIDINWDALLPNGKRLIDPAYSRVLSSVKKVSFLLRCGHMGRPPAPKAWSKCVQQLLNVVRWLVLHELRYQPAVHAFSLLDQTALTTLLCQIARGGWLEAFQIPERLLSTWYRQAYGQPCPHGLTAQAYAVPTDVRIRLSAWLDEHHYYYSIRARANLHRRALNRLRLARESNSPEALLASYSKAACFFRQFEPDLSDGPLLSSGSRTTEYPSHLDATAEEILRAPASQGTVKRVAYALRCLLIAHRHLPLDIPQPTELSLRKALELASPHARQPRHHRFIPIGTGLTYLNEAVRWVHCYGEALIDFYLATVGRIDLNRYRRMSERRKCELIRGAFAKAERKAFMVENRGSRSAIQAVLGIKRFHRLGPRPRIDFDARRAAPTLTEAIEVLIGACVICIAMLKPSREAEIAHLPRNCLVEGNDGYYLRFELGKSNFGEAFQSREKPIPVITAKAIRLLQKLGSKLSKLYGERRKCKDTLFYLPSNRIGEPTDIQHSVINNYLDSFCDYVGLPPDALGRRWYVRVHEMRRWFLLLLFWSGRWDVLDAVRWIAGHVNAAHTYAYIEAEFPGEELPGIEAEYSIDRLRDLDRAKRAVGANSGTGQDGLEVLYERVCQHFNVGSLAMVPEAQWAEYVVTLRAEDGFSLHPHSIYGEDGDSVVGLSVSFVLTEARV